MRAIFAYAAVLGPRAFITIRTFDGRVAIAGHYFLFFRLCYDPPVFSSSDHEIAANDQIHESCRAPTHFSFDDHSAIPGSSPDHPPVAIFAASARAAEAGLSSPIGCHLPGNEILDQKTRSCRPARMSES